MGKCPIECKGGRTKQSMRNDCDINNIIKKYVKTGVMPPPTKKAIYGDFSMMPNMQERYNAMIRAEGAYNSLSPQVRDRFKTPKELLMFLSDKNNMAEAERLGLVVKRQEQKKEEVKKEEVKKDEDK